MMEKKMAQQYSEKEHYGLKPDFSKITDTIGLNKALNWLSYHNDSKKCRKNIEKYSGKKFDSVSDSMINLTAGNLAEMILHGLVYDRENIKNKLDQMISEMKIDPTTPKVNRVSPADRVKSIVSTAIGEIEHQLDLYIKAKFKSEFSPVEFMNENGLKPRMIAMIKNHFENEMIQMELDSLQGDSSIHPKQIIKIKEWLGLINPKKEEPKPKAKRIKKTPASKKQFTPEKEKYSVLVTFNKKYNKVNVYQGNVRINKQTVTADSTKSYRVKPKHLDFVKKNIKKGNLDCIEKFSTLLPDNSRINQDWKLIFEK